MRARLSFDGGRLDTIVNMDNNRQFGFFRLDPRLITMLSSPNGEQRLFVPRSALIYWWIRCWRPKTVISMSMTG